METFLSGLVGFTAWLFKVSCQTAVVIGLVLVAQFLFQRRLSPRWRYGLWLLVVIRLLLPVTPGSPFSIFNYTQGVRLMARETAASEVSRPGRPGPPATLSVATPAGSPSVSRRSTTSPPAAHSASSTLPQTQNSDQPVIDAPAESNRSETSQSSPPTGPSSASGKRWSWPMALSLLWLGGVFFLLARIIWFPLRLNAQLARHETATGPAVFEILEQSKRLMGMRKVLPIVQSRAVASPALLGFIRPLVQSARLDRV